MHMRKDHLTIAISSYRTSVKNVELSPPVQHNASPDDNSRTSIIVSFHDVNGIKMYPDLFPNQSLMALKWQRLSSVKRTQLHWWYVQFLCSLHHSKWCCWWPTLKGMQCSGWGENRPPLCRNLVTVNHETCRPIAVHSCWAMVLSGWYQALFIYRKIYHSSTSCFPRVATTNLSKSCIYGLEGFTSAKQHLLIPNSSATQVKLCPSSNFLIILPCVQVIQVISWKHLQRMSIIVLPFIVVLSCARWPHTFCIHFTSPVTFRSWHLHTHHLSTELRVHCTDCNNSFLTISWLSA